MSSTTITTVSNQSLDLLAPVPDYIHILDIAHGLALQCRFAGQIQEFYSVAQHSIMVSRLVPPEDALWGLLHDASEAYICDIVTPVKQTPLMTGYRMIEAAIMNAVRIRFRVPGDMPTSVKEADKIALATEFRDLRGYSDDAAQCAVGARAAAQRIDPVDWQTARRLFMDRFREITSWRRAQ